MLATDEVIGKARSYRAFIAVLRAYFEEKQITRETLDAHCGLKSRHSSKLLTEIPIKHFGPTSLTLLLQRCDLELWIVRRRDSEVLGTLQKSERPRRTPSKEMPVS